MKKFLFLFILLFNVGYSYVTSTVGSLQDRNILVYNDKFKINTYSSKIDLPFLSSSIHDIEVNKKFQPLEENEDTLSETIEVSQIKFQDIFNFILFKQLKNKEKFFINDTLCQLSINDDEVYNEIIGNKSSKYFKVICDGKKVFGMQVVKIEEGKYLPVEFYIKGKKFELTRIINDDVKKYIEMKKTLKTVLDNFDFSKEPIWGTYVVHTEDGEKFLKAIFKMEDKANKIFSITLKSKFNILNPLQHSSMKVESIAYLIERDSLYEIQNVWLLNSEPILKWVIQDGEVIMVYLDEKNQQQQVEMYLSKLPYDISGLWYLVSYCSENNINNYKFSFMANNTRFEGIMNKTSSNSYEIKAYSGDVLIYNYKFFVDKYNRVKKVEDLKNDYDIKIKEFLNKTIERNRKVLKEFFNQHHLKVIDE